MRGAAYMWKNYLDSGEDDVRAIHAGCGASTSLKAASRPRVARGHADDAGGALGGAAVAGGHRVRPPSVAEMWLAMRALESAASTAKPASVEARPQKSLDELLLWGSRASLQSRPLLAPTSAPSRAAQ